jgi:Flp pilus assembly protein TadG
MTRRTALKTLHGDARGATIVEFAIILPALCVVLLAIFELGYRSYAASVLQGALHEAARMATVGGITQAQIDAAVRARLSNFSSHGTITITTSSYYEFSGVRMPERITNDTTPIGTYNAGDCYEDANNNGAYDLDRGAAGMGGSDDIVRYEVSFTAPRIVPIHQFLGWSATEPITGNTVLRNQPFAGRTNSAVQRCS